MRIGRKCNEETLSAKKVWKIIGCGFSGLIFDISCIIASLIKISISIYIRQSSSNIHYKGRAFKTSQRPFSLLR